MKKLLCTAVVLFGLGFSLNAQNAQSDFAKGEEFFMQNKPKEAMPYLENSVAADSANLKAFLYLGIVYQQLDMTDEAIAVYRKVLPRGGDETARIAYNLGNAYYSKGNAVFADQFYTQAIEADPAYAPAYLNRGNTRIKSESRREAVSDYETFLTLEPRSPKRPDIERLIAFIREEFAAEERRRIMEEEAARAAAERRQQLLDELTASLQAASAETQGLSAGSEGVEGYEGEFELE
ncbi:MAG: tetratricopeptide repeat protein [Treponema sp.]|nr:tetratricopeptide repeat protein [Treponema sp.]